jgi:hypothetical protein
MLTSCPHCRDSIRADARKCQLCGFGIVMPARRWPYALRALAMFPLAIAATLTIVAIVVAPTTAIVSLAGAFAGAGVALVAIGMSARTPTTPKALRLDVIRRARAFRRCFGRYCPTCTGHAV